MMHLRASQVRLTKLALIVFWLLFAVCDVSATVGSRSPECTLSNSTTQENGPVALKTGDGIVFVWNRRDLAFTLAIKGNDIRPMDDPNNIFFTVDGLVLQIQSLPISNFAPNARKDKLDDKSILLAHQKWESKFIEDELLHSKLSLKSSNEKLGDGSELLIWQYDLPANLRNPDAKTQMYLTVVAKDYLILLNSVVNAKGSEAAVRQFLLETIASLKVSPDPIDVKKLQEAIRKGEKP